MLIGVDFDNTLVQGDKALPGAKEAMEAFRERGHKILIHSCNGADWIRKVLGANDIPYDYIWGTYDGERKPRCDCFIDDLAIAFTGDWVDTVAQVKGLAERSTKERGLPL